MIAHQLPMTLWKRWPSRLFLLGFAAVQRDAFHVLAHPHQAVAEVRLDTLLAEPQRGKGTADKVGQPCADDRIHQRDPDHVAGDADAEQRNGAGKRPQDAKKAEQRNDVRQQADAERERVVDEVANVLGDALIWVVSADGCAVGRKADAIIGAISQPFIEEAHGQPATPADLQPLREIGVVDGDQDIDCGNLAESGHEAARCAAVDEQQPEERRKILVLEGVEELAIPEAQNHRHADQQQPERHDRQQQPPGRPLLLGTIVRPGEMPDVAKELPEFRHEAAISRQGG